jgi:hypothetical protein
MPPVLDPAEAFVAASTGRVHPACLAQGEAPPVAM